MMRSLLPFLLTVVSSLSESHAAHGPSHGYLHTAAHRAHARALGQTTTFPGVSMFPNGTLSGLGLSTACENVLYQTINCDQGVSSLLTEDYIGSFDNATETALVCDASCGSSISKMHDAVLTSCGASAYFVPGMTYLSLVDELWSNWNQSCFADPTTGVNCNDEIASFDNVTSLSDMSTTDLCSYCYVKKLELMQRSAYSDVYNDDWQSTFEYVATTCNLTIDNFNATSSAFNVSVPTTKSSCVSGDIYSTKSGDTCDSIALAKGVSAATMYYTNPNILNCSDIQVGTSLCLPLTCTDIYSVQPNDTCASIAVENFITSVQVINWNSQLNSNCSNLHSTNPYWGSALCVSAPGGNYTGQALNTSSSTTPEAVNPPAGVTVALGTTLDCGTWFVNEASLGYNCSDICLANSIPIHLFTEANPSLNYTTCDSDLVTGDAYCVDPLSGWQFSNMTSTGNATSTVTAASSATAPTQTGIAANCDAYYEAQSGDSCASVAAEFGITLAQFIAWNLAVSSDCTSGFWAKEDYCVGIKSNTSTSTSTKTSSQSSTSTSSSTSITPPAATQSGIPSTCDKYAVAPSGGSCSALATDNGITLAQFLAWNPSVSSDCTTGFWAEEAYCVGVSGESSATQTSSTSTTSSATSITPPAPTQSGIPADCNEYYVAQEGDTCATVETKYDITKAQFLAWNPAVSSDCETGFWSEEAYCVSVS